MIYWFLFRERSCLNFPVATCYSMFGNPLIASRFLLFFFYLPANSIIFYQLVERFCKKSLLAHVFIKEATFGRREWLSATLRRWWMEVAVERTGETGFIPNGSLAFQSRTGIPPAQTRHLASTVLHGFSLRDAETQCSSIIFTSINFLWFPLNFLTGLLELID